MAQSLQTLQNAVLRSIHGRYLGLDQKGYLVGPPGVRAVVEDLTTTAASSALPYGMTRVLTSGSSQHGAYTLQAPVVGVSKTLSLNSTSTGGMHFTATSASIYNSSDGTTSAVVNLYRPGASVTLFAVTTDRWLVTGGNYGTSDGRLVTFTTST